MTRRIPSVPRIVPSAADHSPTYGNGQGDAAVNLFAGIVADEDARERAIEAVAVPLSIEAAAALEAGDRKRAAELYDECAALYLAGGFKFRAQYYTQRASETRTPPKTIGRGKRGGR